MYWIDYDSFNGENHASLFCGDQAICYLLCNDRMICYGTIAEIKSLLELLS